MQLDRSITLGSHRALSAARCRQRRAGVATVEAVIVLPVFGILLVGTLLLHQLYSAHQKALVTARRCAFEYAVHGCVEVPPSCRGRPTTGQSDEGKERSQKIVSDARVHEDNQFDVFAKVPVIGSAIDGIFGTTARASAPMLVRMPWTEADSVQGNVQIALACNEHTHDSVVREIEHIFCDYLPALHCGASTP
jgi:hypothetical protein